MATCVPRAASSKLHDFQQMLSTRPYKVSSAISRLNHVFVILCSVFKFRNSARILAQAVMLLNRSWAVLRPERLLILF
jgi:hypothetical protein